MEDKGEIEVIRRLNPLVGLVLNGEKPGAYIGLDNAKKYQKLGLEAIEGTDWTGERKARPNKLIIGKPETTVIEVLKTRAIPEIPQIQARVTALFAQIKDKSVAQALVFLIQNPRQDEEYPIVEEDNLERPEIAVAQGILLGYKKCCIKYYIETRYLGAPAHKDERKDFEQKYINPYIRCSVCVSTRK